MHKDMLQVRIFKVNKITVVYRTLVKQSPVFISIKMSAFKGFHMKRGKAFSNSHMGFRKKKKKYISAYYSEGMSNNFVCFIENFMITRNSRLLKNWKKYNFKFLKHFGFS